MSDPGKGLRIKKKGGKTLFSAAGICLLLFPLLYLISRPEQPLPFSAIEYIKRLVLVMVFLKGIEMFSRGFHARILLNKLKKLEEAFGGAHRVPLDVAADMLGCSLSELAGDVRDIQQKGMVRGLYVDLIRKDLVYMGDKVLIELPVGPPDNSIILREEQRKSALPIYMLGITWVVCAFFFPFYRSIDFALAALLSLIVYFKSSWNTPARIVIAEQKQEIIPPATTGNQALDEMLDGVTAHISNLRRLDEAIQGKLDEPVRDILRTTEQIVEQIRKNIALAGEIRQFFNYTLPTTIDLLQSYDELSRQPIQGRNIAAAMEKIEGMMDTIVEAFHRQLDSLFRDKALNIEVELEVMKSMVSQAGNIIDNIND